MVSAPGFQWKFALAASQWDAENRFDATSAEEQLRLVDYYRVPCTGLPKMLGTCTPHPDLVWRYFVRCSLNPAATAVQKAEYASNVGTDLLSRKDYAGASRWFAAAVSSIIVPPPTAAPQHLSDAAIAGVATQVFQSGTPVDDILAKAPVDLRGPEAMQFRTALEKLRLLKAVGIQAIPAS